MAFSATGLSAFGGGSDDGPGGKWEPVACTTGSNILNFTGWW